MMPMFLEKIPAPFAWTSDDIAKDNRWCFPLTQFQKREFESYIEKLKPMVDTTRPVSYPALPTSWQHLMKAILIEVSNGYGFAVLQGVEFVAPVDVVQTFLFAIGASIGTPISQNLKGERVARVQDASAKNPNIRGYSSRTALPFHTDTSDILVLACIRTAKTGGENALVNALSIHNGFLTTSTESLKILYRGFRYTYPEDTDHLTYRIPVYSFTRGDVSCRYLRGFIDATEQKFPGTISATEKKVLDEFDEWTENERLSIRLCLRPGDILFLNNHTNLHSRTEFIDFEEPFRRRLLLRLWLSVPCFRNLHPRLAAQMSRFNGAPQLVRSWPDETLNRVQNHRATI